MRRAKGAADDVEIEVLREDGVDLPTLERFAATSERLMAGARRAFRTPVIDPTVEGGADDRGLYVDCMFTLAPGAYATVVLDEVMKSEPPRSACDDES